MVRCLDNTQIDLDKWDICVQESRMADPYGISWFLNSICDNWIGLILDDYQAVMPLAYSKKLGVNYIYQPTFFQRTAIYSKLNLNETSIANFYATIPKIYKLHEFAVNETSIPPKEFAYQIIERPNLLLNLNKPYEELKKRYNSNTKRKLKKAQNYDLKIQTSHDPSEMIQAYTENLGKKNALTIMDNARINQLINHAIEHNCGQILEAYTQENEFAGGVFILSALNRHILLFMSTNSKAKETGASCVLIDYFLQKKANTNKIFDFEGSGNAGVAQFYKGFGSVEEKYYSVKRDDLNKLIRFAKKIRG